MALNIAIGLAAALVGALAAWLLVWNALHERVRRAEAAAEALEEQAARRAAAVAQADGLRGLSEAAFNALLLLDDERRVLHLNQAARMLFHREADTQPNPNETLISLTRNIELDNLIAETLAQGEGLDHQLTFMGSTYRARTLVLPARGGDVRLALALEDVSELQRLGRARRDMVANISHELRTPITSIRLLVDTLTRNESEVQGRTLTLLHKIASETDTLQQMAQELLDLAMIESGRAEFILLPVSLAEIVHSAVEQYSEQMRRDRITPVVSVPDDLTVLADEQQVRRVLSNLLHNAIKFTPQGSEIAVRAAREDDSALVSVTDSGPGIPPDERDRVFERFYRSDRARRGAGTGLGLAIAKHIVQAHGGRIWAADPGQPSGAKLCFTLPLAQPRESKNRGAERPGSVG